MGRYFGMAVTMEEQQEKKKKGGSAGRVYQSAPRGVVTHSDWLFA